MNQADELLRLVRVAAAAADDKKADETLIIDVGDVFAVSDYFVITSGSNPRQVNAIADAVEEEVKNAGDRPRACRRARPTGVGADGLRRLRRACFHREQRDFYQLERLWGDRPRVDWEPMNPRSESA